MSNVQELIDKRAKLWQDTKNFLDEHTKDGLLSDEDAATYEKMESDVVALGKSIERLERQARFDAELAAPVTKPILNMPNDSPAIKTGTASNEYKQAALTALRSNFQKVTNYLSEGIAADGGYLVPDEWDSRLMDILEEENILRQLATEITTSGAHKINITATRPAASWVAEGAPLTFQAATFGQKTLDAHKLHVGIQVTNELLYDNKFNLENHIIEQFGKALANAEEDAFINGTGVGRPTGILTTAAADSDMTVTTTGAAISADDIINLAYGLKRPYRKNAVFVVNDATISLIRKFKDSTLNYIWTPSYVAGEADRILGYPVYTTPYMPLAGTSGNMAVIFGDLSYYNIGDRETRTFRELRERYADNDMTAFLMTERVDGLLLINEAVKVLEIK